MDTSVGPTPDGRLEDPLAGPPAPSHIQTSAHQRGQRTTDTLLDPSLKETDISHLESFASVIMAQRKIIHRHVSTF